MTDGILLVDKPAGPTSHDVVATVRRLTSQRRVGHAGTLDPAATGLLVVLLGRYTRLAEGFSGTAKTYRAVVALGSATDTGDAEGRVTAEAPVAMIEPGRAEAAVAALVGQRRHVPPAYSAVKVQGRTLHRIARAGGPVPEAPARTIDVLEARLVAAEVASAGSGAPATLTLDLTVSKGTYVRVLAEELGASLGLPAHLAALRRTAVGPFGIDEAVPLDGLGAEGAGALAGHLVDVGAHVLPLPRAAVEPEAIEAVRHGRPIEASRLEWIDEPGADALIVQNGSIVAWYARGSESTGLRSGGSEPSKSDLMRPRAVLERPGVVRAS